MRSRHPVGSCRVSAHEDVVEPSADHWAQSLVTPSSILICALADILEHEIVALSKALDKLENGTVLRRNAISHAGCDALHLL